MDVTDSSKEIVDYFEQINKDNPLMKAKKRRVILWFKTFFNDFIELYIKAEDIANTFELLEIDFAENLICNLKKFKELIDFPQEFLNTNEDEVISSFAISEFSELLRIVVPKVEEAKFALVGICNLSDLVIKCSSSPQSISPDDFENRMSQCVDNYKEIVENDLSEIKKLIREYIETLEQLMP